MSNQINTTVKQLTSIELEQAVLASLMSIANAFQTNQDILSINTFNAHRNQLIFQAIKDCEESINVDHADVVIVKDRLKAQGKLEDAGGQEYLTKLIKDSPATLFNLRRYTIRLNDLATRRKALSAINVSRDKLLEIDTKPHDAINDCINELLNTNIEDKKYHNANMQECLGLVIEQMRATVEMGGEPFYIFGMPELENKIGLVDGNLCVVAGRPGMGKTILGENLTRGFVKSTGKLAMIFSLEMPSSELTKRMVSAESSVELYKIRNSKLANAHEWSKITDSFKSIEQYPIFINEKPRITLAEIRTEINKMKKSHDDIGLVMIDYLQIMGGIGTENRANEIGLVTASLKAMAKDYNCPIILLAQLNRGNENSNRRPALSDLKGSGAIEQDADIVLLLHREDYYNKDTEKKPMTGVVEIDIAKNRAGATGVVNMHFNGQYQRLDDITPEMMESINYGH